MCQFMMGTHSEKCIIWESRMNIRIYLHKLRWLQCH